MLSLLETLGTVRAVAETLRLSASTVSQQLAVLERETRCQLLERVGRRVRLTPAGLLPARTRPRSKPAPVMGITSQPVRPSGRMFRCASCVSGTR